MEGGRRCRCAAMRGGGQKMQVEIICGHAGEERNRAVGQMVLNGWEDMWDMWTGGDV